MKKKITVLLSLVFVFLIGLSVWYSMPIDLLQLDPGEVKEIVFFNGNNGKSTFIQDSK